MKLFKIVLAVATISIAHAQCDSLCAINTAKKSGYYVETPRGVGLKSHIKFDSMSQTWNLYSEGTHTTRKGKCKKNNGCTIFTQYKATISYISGSIIDSARHQKVYPNYE